MIHLSKTAISEIIRLRTKYQKPDALFRLGVQSTGCSGMSYVMNFDPEVRPNDQVYNSGGIQVVVDPQSLNYLDGLTLDYSEDLMGGAFRFDNPNAVKSCGCGNSFNVSE